MQQIKATFRLSDKFIARFDDKVPPFGFNGFGELVFRRTYAREKPDGTMENWTDTVRRVVEGTYRMQERFIKAHYKNWNAQKAQKSAQEMFERMWEMKFTPPGRGLWAMGSDLTEGDEPIYAALQNCAFTSTENIAEELEKPFAFLMDLSMLGVGVGFDTKGAGKITIQKPDTAKYSYEPEGPWRTLFPNLPYQQDARNYKGELTVWNYGIQTREDDWIVIIPDTREGWVVAMIYVLAGYFRGHKIPKFSLEQIRPAGMPIKRFGGKSCGPEVLGQLLENLKNYLDSRVGQLISTEDIVTIQNMIGVAVVAGNVRRTAEIAFAEHDDTEFMSLKDYRWDNKEFKYVGPRADRSAYGWTSNNSIFAKLGMDYTYAANRTAINGEPGYAWLENMRQYSRMGELDNKDYLAKGGNPCLEQTLFHMELCTLVETYPARHESKEDYLRTLKFAYLYAKTVTLGMTHWLDTNEVMSRNRRIGCSVSGFAQAMVKFGIHDLKDWLRDGYDTIGKYDVIYSDWFGIPRSIKKTSIKPSGTVSLLAGATPGMHFPESRYCIRRMRLSIHSELIEPLKKAGYDIEPCVGQEDSTVVVSVPIDHGEGVRGAHEVSMWEQLETAAFIQEHWADNQVSCTVTFDPANEGSQIKYALDFYQYRLKGVSFLPRLEAGAYAQMPYEAITQEKYKEMRNTLFPIDWNTEFTSLAEMTDLYCDGDSCKIVR